MIRDFEPKDVPWLKEVAKDFEGELGPEYVDGLVYTDSEGKPVMFIGGWKRVELHAAIDPRWQEPGTRWEAFRELHGKMETRMRQQGFLSGFTWLDSGFGKRLRSLGWAKEVQEFWRRRL
jgi:hypothetical protein